MADDTKREISGGKDEFRALSDIRAALEAAELEHGRMERNRRRLRDQLDELLTSLRDGALLLLFDADGELAGAEGPIDDHLGISLTDLVERFDDFTTEDTFRELKRANKDVMAPDSAGVSVSRSALRSEKKQVSYTWVHLRRHDDDDALIGAEVIGVASMSPEADQDDSAEEGPDPYESLLQQLSRRLLDDAGDATIRRALEAFGDLLDVDRVVINRYDEDDRAFSILSSWLRGDVEPLAAEAKGISISELPWAYSLLGAGESVVVSESAGLPAEATAERRIYAADGVESSLLVPMVRKDHLFGFVSIQCAGPPRDWNALDVAHASGFVRLLSATLARREVETELAEARDAAAAAEERAKGAESRSEKAEDRAKEAAKKTEELESEAKDARRRVEELERDLQKAHKAEREARSLADKETDRSKEARTEAEKIRSEVKKVRRELQTTEDDLRQAQRRVEDAEAEVSSLRAELHKGQERVESALRDAKDARDELRELREADRAAAEVVRQATTKLAAMEDSQPGQAAEPSAGGPVGSGFDPDATLEVELSSLVERREREAKEAAAQIAELEEAEETREAPGRRRQGRDDDATPRSVDLDKALEHTQVEERLREAREEFGEAPWGSSARGSALPSVLREEREIDDEEHEEGSLDAGADDEEWRPARDRGDQGLDADEGRDLDGDVAAARSMARRAAGIEEERDEDDWRDVRAGDDDREIGEAESEAHERDTNRSRDDAVVIETAWEDRPEVLDDVAQRDTAPPAETAFREVEAAETERVDREIDAVVSDLWPGDAEGGEDVEETEETPVVELAELEGIDAEIGLQDVGGNEELYRSLLTKFRNDYIGAAAKIEAAIEKGNIEVAHLLLHAIKGVSGILGATRVHDSADELETRLIDQDADARHAAVGDFTVALNQVLDSISLLEAPPPGDAEEEELPPEDVWQREATEGGGNGVSDPMVLRSYLSGLRQHLVAEKPRQCRLVMREITARKWPAGFDERVAELNNHIVDASFEDARGAFDGLMAMFDED